jgi:hypothetical protein
VSGTLRSLRDKLELYQAILFAIVGLLAEVIVGYILHQHDVPAKWRMVLLTIFALPPIIITWWFLTRLTTVHVRFANKVARSRIAIFDTAKDWSKLVIKWSRYVGQGTNPSFSQIRSAIGKQYLEQELLDLSGEGDLIHRKYHLLPDEERRSRNPEGRPLIFTSFVRYSALVEAMVKTALAQRPASEDSMIMCVTTLSMGLQKWFNFDDKAHSVYKEWEDYLKFLRSNLKSLPNVLLSRFLLVREPNIINTRVNLRPINELDEELRNWVWLTKKGPDYHEFSAANVLEPISAERRLHILSDLKDRYAAGSVEFQCLTQLKSITTPNRDSYLILPRTQFAQCPSGIDGGEFVEVGQAFISAYHTRKSDGSYHAYYSVVEPSDYVPDPSTDDAPYPLDLFYVAMISSPNGKRPESDDLARLPRTPLFCLAARPDEELHMVYLHLLDPQRCPRNFKEIEQYITRRLQTPRPLNSYSSGALT